jgi:hypothetical protein
VLLDCVLEDGEGLAEDFILMVKGCDEWRGGGQCGCSRENREPVRVIAEWRRGVKARGASKKILTTEDTGDTGKPHLLYYLRLLSARGELCRVRISPHV